MFDHSKFHLLEPNFERPVFEISNRHKDQILKLLRIIYPEEKISGTYQELERIMKVYYAYKSEGMIKWEKTFDPEERFTEKDIILITYGDLIHKDAENPLKTLAYICENYLKGVFSAIHILPFFPFSSDRGFSVMDFEEVDPRLGSWEDIAEIKKDFRLMFDGVINHVSSKSKWFQEFLNQNPDYNDVFIVFSTRDEISKDHLKLIVRPRTSDLLTPFQTLNGTRWVWTTFSKDQIDLNFHNPVVLIKVVEILLTYVRRGADSIRLDAVTYLWHEIGTNSVHLKQTHAAIKLFRKILNAVAPHVALITETNVNHKDNIGYFGNGWDEAQMVYNFALPPLVVHSFHNENTRKLTEWAQSLECVSSTATYFNFLDSHDGIGLMAVDGILAEEEIQSMILRVLEHGGFISYKSRGDGTDVPYEMNITWYSAINREDDDEPLELKIQRYLASRAIALVLMGVPGVYFHGFIGSQNDAEAVIEEEERRIINRKVINFNNLAEAVLNPESATYHITRKLSALLGKRSREKAFHPNSPQKVLDVSENLFVVVRTTLDKSEVILTITNVTNRVCPVEIDKKYLDTNAFSWYDLIEKKHYHFAGKKIKMEVKPYGIVWIKGVIN
jgi:sucrose phosphorylase